MADISAIFGSLLIMGMVFPGLLITCWLLFPATVERARLCLDRTPWRCFWFGGVISALAILPVVILLLLPFGPAKFLAWIIIALLLFISSFGSAGIVAKMSENLSHKFNGSPAMAFLQSALALELAIFFPVLGWLIVFPLVTVTALGATGFALLRRVPGVHSGISTEAASVQA